MNLNQAIRIIQEAEVSHNINLGFYNIRDQGISALENMIKNSKFPSYIILGGNELDAAMQNNDAILAIQNPKKFESKIENIFTTSLPALTFRDLPEDLNNIIIRYIGQQETNHMNLQYLQDLRIRALKNQTGKEITPAGANYAIKNLVTKHYDEKELGGEDYYAHKAIGNTSYSTGHCRDLGKLDMLATGMLLNEHLGADALGGKESQYSLAIVLAITSSALGYQAGAQSFYIPIARAGIFMSKNYMSDNLETKVIDILNQNNVVNHYNPWVMSIAVKTICNIAMSIASPSFKHTFVVNTLDLISNQLEVNPNSEHVAIGGVIATKQLLENYTTSDVGKTYYESASLVLGAFYIGKIAT